MSVYIQSSNPQIEKFWGSIVQATASLHRKQRSALFHFVLSSFLARERSLEVFKLLLSTQDVWYFTEGEVHVRASQNISQRTAFHMNLPDGMHNHASGTPKRMASPDSSRIVRGSSSLSCLTQKSQAFPNVKDTTGRPSIPPFSPLSRCHPFWVA